MTAQYSAMLDWGLRVVVLLAVPRGGLADVAPAVGGHSVSLRPFTDRMTQTTSALMGYGLACLVGGQSAAPGFYASQNIKTPVLYCHCGIVITH
jgi:putative peptidoglycan lipid II flippase